MNELRNKLIEDKENIRKSIKNNYPFDTAKFMNILADLIEYVLDSENIDNIETINHDQLLKAFNSSKKEEVEKLRSKLNEEEKFQICHNTENHIQDLINKYKCEKESMIDSLNNLMDNFVCDLENIKKEME